MEQLAIIALAHLHGDVHPFFRDFSFTVLVHVAHSLSGCYFQRMALEKSQFSWQYSMVATTFCVVAGGVCTNLVFGLHPRVLNSEFLLPCTVFCWYLMNYSPYDLVFRLYHNFTPFRVISEALHRIHQLRSLAFAVGLGSTHGTPYVGALFGGLVSATASAFVREFVAGKPSPLQKPGYTFTVLSWGAVLLVSNILGNYTYSTVAIYLVLAEIYFGILGVVIPEPFPLNILSQVVVTSLNLRNPNYSRVQSKDKEKKK